MLLVRMIQHGWSRLPRRPRLCPFGNYPDGNNSSDRIECLTAALFRPRNRRHLIKGSNQFLFRLEDPKPAKGVIQFPEDL